MHNRLAISNINGRFRPPPPFHSAGSLHRRLPRSLPLVSPGGLHKVQAAPSLPRLRCCLARSRSSRPAGCTGCRLPRAFPGSGAASLAPARLARRAAQGAGCPEPSQAPVLPRSLPLVSPGGLHKVQAARSLPRLRCCLARSRSSRPAGCTRCRLPRAFPGSGAASLAPARLARRAAQGAGCPEPSQAPVLPRSLPLVSPGGLHKVQAARALPGPSAPTPASFHNCTCSSVLRRGSAENGHQNPYSRSNFRVHEAARPLLAHASEAGSSTFAIASIA